MPWKQKFKEKFGLTAGEMRIADSLLTGRSLRSCAADLGIAYTTARSQLSAVFQKTHTERQTQLVMLLVEARLQSGAKELDHSHAPDEPRVVNGCSTQGD